jgi:hypothetical protein
MLNVSVGCRDLIIAMAGRVVPAFSDEVLLVALTLGLRADSSRSYVEVLP